MLYNLEEMRKLLYISLILWQTLSVMFAGCSHDATARDAMDEAERLMESRPDSAYVIMTSIDKADLRNAGDQARFALLMTQSMDKNYLEPSDDSLISMAVDYYQKTGDFKLQAMSNYYQGRVRYHLDDYPTAILSFFKAREISERHAIFFWAGMASRGISDIYDNTYNHIEALHYATDEYEYMRKIGRQPYLNYALCDLSRSLCNNGMIDQSMSLCKQLLDSADKYDDQYLRYSSMYNNVWNLIKARRYGEAYPHAEEICSMEFADSSDSLDLCHIMCEMGEIEQARQLLNQICSTDTMRKSLLEYKIAKGEHDYKRALERSEFFQIKSGSLLEGAISNNLTSALTEHLKSEICMEVMNSDRSRLHHLLVICILVGAIIIIWIIFIQYRNRQRQKILDKVLLAEQFQETFNKSEQEKSHVLDSMRSLLSSRYRMLEDLSYIVYRNSDTNAARRQIAEAVEKVIDDMSIGGDRIKVLEEEVNVLYDNIYFDFRTDIPNLKEADYRLFLFSIVGFSSAVIALFLKEAKLDAVYNRKRKLKQKIRQLDEKKIERYLSVL